MTHNVVSCFGFAAEYCDVKINLCVTLCIVSQPAFVVQLPPPLPSNRHHPSSGDCLESKGENYQVCSVQYCVQQLCTVRCTHI